MPKYDEEKDTEMQFIGSVPITATSEVLVSVRSYDGDEPRISIVKEVRGFTSGKLGRLSPDQARDVAALMLHAASWIESYLCGETHQITPT